MARKSKVAVSPDAKPRFRACNAKQALMLAARHGAADPLSALFETFDCYLQGCQRYLAFGGQGMDASIVAAPKLRQGLPRGELPLHKARAITPTGWKVYMPTTCGAYDMDYHEHTDRSRST